MGKILQGKRVLRVAEAKVNEINRIRNEKQVSIDHFFFVKHVVPL